MHLDDDPGGAVKRATEGRGVDLSVEAVGHPSALDMACRMARKAGTVSVIGVYAERAEVHMGVVWIKGLKLVTGQANVIAHVDAVLAMLSHGRAGPHAARHPPHAARRRSRRLRDLRPPRGPEDRAHALGGAMTTTLPDALSDTTRAFVARDHGLLIGGEHVPAADGATFATLDPATGQADRLRARRRGGRRATAPSAPRARRSRTGRTGARCRRRSARSSCTAWPT